MARAVRWDLIADPRRYQKGFREAEQTTKHFHGMVTRTASLIGGAFAAIQVGSFLKDSINEGREAAKVGKQTAAVIKSTGGVAKVTAKEVSGLAESISGVVGVDDELIQSGENWLLTFKKVRDEAGKGNDIFSRATKAAVDLAASMHQGEVTASGLHSANTALGKALNDPIKGMVALGRAGVQFNDQQREQIKTLIASGDQLGAQKIILGEVESQVKGFAKASADPWDKMKVAVENAKEELGTALLPTLETVVGWLSVTIPAAIDTLKTSLKNVRDWWDHNKESVQALGDILMDTFVPGADAANGEARTFADTLKTLDDHLTNVAVAALEAVKAWLVMEHVTIGLISVYGSALMAAGHLINAMDRLSGGTGHAGDQFVKFGKQVKDQATAELITVREESKKAQAAIDKLHGKDVTITAQGVFVPPKELKAAWAQGGILKAMPHATGGPISGPGTGTSDSIPIWASAGEHMWTAKEVRNAGGHGAVEAIRAQYRYAAGGPIEMPVGRLGQAATRFVDRLAAAIDRLTINVPMPAMFPPHIPGGWQQAVSFLHGIGIPANVISSFRPGAVTHASGRQSYHALNRAVDLTGPDMLRIFNALVNTNPTELIYSRAPFYISRRGRRPIGALDPITRADHYSHVHAAYRHGGAVGFDQGGWLRPGLTMAVNSTGRSEPVGIDYTKLGKAVAAALASNPPVVYLDRQKVTRAVRDGVVWDARGR